MAPLLAKPIRYNISYDDVPRPLFDLQWVMTYLIVLTGDVQMVPEEEVSGMHWVNIGDAVAWLSHCSARGQRKGKGRCRTCHVKNFSVFYPESNLTEQTNFLDVMSNITKQASELLRQSDLCNN